MSVASRIVRHFRLRHGLSARRMADICGLQPKRLAALERGEIEPCPELTRRLIDLSHRLPGELLGCLSSSVARTTLPRALSRSSRLRLEAVSGPAIEKRPSIVDWIGKDLAPVACGVLRSMLDDGDLQRAIKKREVASIVTTTRGVLRIGDCETIGTYRTTITYFFHEGEQFSDAIAVAAPDGERTGFTPLLVDEIGADLFGDHAALETGMMAGIPKPARNRVQPTSLSSA